MSETSRKPEPPLLDLLAMQRGLPAPDLRSITSSASAGLTVSVEAWDATGQTYRRWRFPLACTVFVVAVAEKPAGQFMMRNRTRVVKPASGRRPVRAKLQSGHSPYRDTTPSTRDSGNIDSMDDSAILRAEQYVAEAHRIVASQRIIVEQLYAAGCDTLDAEQTLRVFEKSLRTFEGHRDWLRKHGADK